MSADELIDVITPTGEPLGTMTRAEAHDGGHWHQTFHALVVRPASRSVILQERSPQKANFPGLLDLSATGHLTAGESPADGIRELNEELGIDADPAALVPAGIRLLADDLGEGGQNRERVHVFFLADDRPMTDYRPPADEVSALVEIDVDEFVRLFAANNPVCAATRWAGTNPPQAITVRAQNLVVPTDGYWIVLAVMAQRFANGELPVAV